MSNKENSNDVYEKTHFVYLHETVRQSIARDIGTVAIFMLLWSFGHFVGSASLEWVGAVVAMIIIFSNAMRSFHRHVKNRMTPDEARDWLDKKFPQEPKP